jgi:hypothetical protein
MSDLKHVAFFGDHDHTFLLTPAMIRELEAVTGTGIGAIYRRLTERDFRHGDMLAVIRLGLIGGGASPQIAAGLVATYAEPTPILEIYKLALDVLTVLFFGQVESEDDAGRHVIDESVFEDAGQGA